MISRYCLALFSCLAAQRHRSYFNTLKLFLFTHFTLTTCCPENDFMIRVKSPNAQITIPTRGKHHAKQFKSTPLSQFWTIVTSHSHGKLVAVLKLQFQSHKCFPNNHLTATVTFEGSKPTALWVISNNGQSTDSTTQCTVQGLTATRLGHMLGPSTWAAPPSPPAAHQLYGKLYDILHQLGLFMGEQ